MTFSQDAHTYEEAMVMLMEHRRRGHWLPQYCHKEVDECFCAVGYPPELQHEACREDFIRDSRCECAAKSKS